MNACYVQPTATPGGPAPPPPSLHAVLGRRTEEAPSLCPTFLLRDSSREILQGIIRRTLPIICEINKGATSCDIFTNTIFITDIFTNIVFTTNIFIHHVTFSRILFHKYCVILLFISKYIFQEYCVAPLFMLVPQNHVADPIIYSDRKHMEGCKIPLTWWQ